MNKRKLILADLVFIIVISASFGGVLAKSEERGLWVWHTAPLLREGSAQNKFFEFLKAPHGDKNSRVNAVYLSCKPTEKNKEALKRFIRHASLCDVRVECLSGNANWVNRHSAPLKILTSVIEYNNVVSPEERFHAIHWDIEGHVLAVFRKEKFRKLIIEKYLELLKKCREKIGNSEGKLKMIVDLPTMYNESYYAQVYHYADTIVLMDYHDRTGRIIVEANNAINAADKACRTVIIGLETQKPIPKYGVTPAVTFYEEGYVKMDKTISQISTLLKNQPAFGGIALHYYRSYVSMKEKYSKVIDKRKYPELDDIKCIFNEHVTIDGLVDKKEWGAVPQLKIDSIKNVVYGRKTWRSTDDFSYIVQACHDEKNLYIALQVKDDIIRQKYTNKHLVSGDHIEIWIDSEYEGDKFNPIADEDDFQIGFSPGNFSDVPPSLYIWYPDVEYEDVRKHVKYMFKQVLGGYEFEVAIPWKFLNVKNTEKGTVFGINIDPSDSDNNDTQECLMSTSPYRKFANPRTFRKMVLE